MDRPGIRSQRIQELQQQHVTERLRRTDGPKMRYHEVIRTERCAAWRHTKCRQRRPTESVVLVRRGRALRTCLKIRNSADLLLWIISSDANAPELKRSVKFAKRREPSARRHHRKVTMNVVVAGNDMILQRRSSHCLRDHGLSAPTTGLFDASPATHKRERTSQ